MSKNEKGTTTITRTVTVNFDDTQIDAILREACGFDSDAAIRWDVDDGCILGVSVANTTYEQS